MHPQRVDPINAEWIGKTEAASRLKISVRTVLQLAANGKIDTRRERDPATNQVAVKFDPVAVERYGYNRDHPEEKPAPKAVQGVSVVPAPPVSPQPQADVSLTNALVQRLLNPPPAAALPPAPRPWLTLDEAAELSGLTKRWLIACAELRLGEESVTAQAVAVRDMGKGSPGGRWRFLRESLEKA